MEPQFPPEIVQKILSHLHRVDLLNSRLVSQSWNQEGLKTLNDLKKLLCLNETNIGDYVKFCEQSPMAPLFLMPITLTLTFGNLKNNQCSSTTDQFKTIISNVDILISLFGPECVSELLFYIHTDAQELIPLALELLTKVNKGLKKLVFWIYDHFEHQEDLYNNYSDLILPRVGKFHMWSGVNPNTTFWNQLAQKCPNLEEIHMLRFRSAQLNDQSWPIQPNMTKIRGLYSTGRIPLPNISNKICGSPCLSNLTWLCLGINSNFQSNLSHVTDLRNILEYLCKTLDTLDLSFYGPITSDPIVIPCGATGAKFVCLKKFRVFIYYTKTFCPAIMIDPSAFPNLESMTFPYSMKLEVSKEIDHPFPKVNSLTLSVREDVGITPTESYKGHMEALQNIFKHVTKVSVINSAWNCTYESGLNSGGRIMYVLEGLIQSAGANKIAELTLEDCQENYLGIILNRINKPPRLVVENLPRNYMMDNALKEIFQKLTGGINLHIIDEDHDERTIIAQQCSKNIMDVSQMLNLKTIRLVLNSWRKSAWNKCFIPINNDPMATINLLDTPRKLYVKTMVKTFPSLEEIQVSSFMFGIDTNVRAEILQKINKKYPNIVVDVI